MRWISAGEHHAGPIILLGNAIHHRITVTSLTVLGEWWKLRKKRKAGIYRSTGRQRKTPNDGDDGVVGFEYDPALLCLPLPVFAFPSPAFVFPSISFNPLQCPWSLVVVLPFRAVSEARSSLRRYFEQSYRVRDSFFFLSAHCYRTLWKEIQPAPPSLIRLLSTIRFKLHRRSNIAYRSYTLSFLATNYHERTLCISHRQDPRRPSSRIYSTRLKFHPIEWIAGQ